MAASQAPNNANKSINVITLSRITVQHDISAVIADVRDGIVTNGWEDVWVSCYHDGKPSVHGKVRISRATAGVSFESRDGIQWQGTSTVRNVHCGHAKLHLTIPPEPSLKRSSL